MSNLSAQSETVATYPIRNYKLAEYAVGQENLESVSVFSLVKKTLGADSVTKVELVGYADATPWKSCGKNASCSDHKNQTLALLRASTISQKFSLEYGINPSRINARGEVSNSRGGEFRGVTVYISRDKGRSSAPVVAQVNPNSFDDVNALRREIAGLRDTVTMLMHRNSVEVSAPAQPTSPKESPTNVTIQTVAPTSIKIERPVNVDVGAGIATVNTNHIDAFAPIVSVFIRPRASPVEFFLNGGFRPSSSLNLCNRADVIGSLGAQVGTRRPIGASFGLYTAREMCSDGGPKLNERWLDRTNGVFVGPKLNFRVMGVNGSFNPALTWSNTYRAEERKDYNGWGLKFDFNIRTFGNQKP
jgi:hypothetical protein